MINSSTKQVIQILADMVLPGLMKHKVTVFLHPAAEIFHSMIILDLVHVLTRNDLLKIIYHISYT